MGPVRAERRTPGPRVAADPRAAYTRSIVSGLSRILTLVLLVGWQVLASGVAGLGHYCEKQVATRATKCRCHEHEKEGGHKASSSPDGPALSWNCCEEPHWDLPAPTEAGGSSGAPFVVAPPVLLPVAWVSPRPPEWVPQRSLSWWQVPPAQGPPVFLRVRTLLI
ncbi:hypothetical protein SAMN05443572_11729 [Myxococcus fulvus]|uniref:Uncharacterized protein n=1 Tax=Myxococcus fulvus TaxID=33 RepID=A0A511TJC7_MYXFU|nr:hypothetical protein MFU01_84790 [Myxococcus fulvus]SEU41594.1 hypothetical protein SAMN05443572_11729 [Myxococcus fulvus]